MDNKSGPPPDYNQASGMNNMNQPQNPVYPPQNPNFYQLQPGQVPYYNPNQTTILMTQQPGIITNAIYTGPPPDNHSALAWLTCLFCCWPLGIVSIIKSMEVNTAIGQGDTMRARMASESARKFGYASLGCGIFLHAIWIIFLIIYLVVIIPSLRSYSNNWNNIG
ncbi:proline rich transmembrane protein 1B isoform X2 [Hydra vulgaris]|uniref:Proline rich transmembrane protein 1B isoform X2 n=1 Tax=Hydra vulgaris TaxID=6087 RepID=A0ABM4C2U9_HYDVU